MHRSLLVRSTTWIAATTVLACLVVAGAGAGPAACGDFDKSAYEFQRVDCERNHTDPATGQPKLNLSPKVTPRLLREVETKGDADILVFVRGRPDLTPARALATKQAKGRFVVEALRTTAEKSQAGLRRLLDARGAHYQAFWIVNMLHVRADRGLVAELASRPEVTKVDINLPIRHLDPDGLEPLRPRDAAGERLAPDLSLSTAPPWGITAIGAPLVWARGIRGQGIVVAGNDTGVQWDHEALINAYRGWNGESADHNYNWHDAWNKTPRVPSDDHGHGTHTIGTVAGDGPEQIGVAPDAKWIACRNMNSGVGTPASYVDCFQFFLAPTDLDGRNPRPALAPHVINNSWSCPEVEGCHPDDPLWNDTIKPAVEALTEAGVAVVVSAGNYGGGGCATVIDPPAIYPQSLTVGATGSGNRIASFSSRGPLTVAGNDFIAPDLAAPGVGVRSSVPGNGYADSSGTSMAGPHVAGTIALLWSAEPQLIGHLAVTEQVLRASATPVVDNTCGGDPDSQPNNVYGWGVINADAAVRTGEMLRPVTGVVADTGGYPAPVTDITIRDLTWRIKVDLKSGPDGHYASPLLPGDYDVCADTAAYFVEAPVFTVPAEGPATHDITLATCADWNGDGRTGVFEIQAVAGDWHNDGFPPEHDLNCDGTVDVLDVAVLTSHFDDRCTVATP